MNFPTAAQGMLMGMALMGSLFITACTDTSEAQQDATGNTGVRREMDTSVAADANSEWERERRESLMKLRTMRDDIDRELERSNKRLAQPDLEPAERRREEAMQTELMHRKTEVLALITKVEEMKDTDTMGRGPDTNHENDGK